MKCGVEVSEEEIASSLLGGGERRAVIRRGLRMRQRLTGTLKDAGIRRQVRGVQVRKEASSGRKNPGSEDTEKGQEK